MTLSFWAVAGPEYSGGPLTANLVSGTGVNQSAANLIAGSWTNASFVINTTQGL
jgi:hypothetical protein